MRSSYGAVSMDCGAALVAFTVRDTCRSCESRAVAWDVRAERLSVAVIASFKDEEFAVAAPAQ